MESHSLSQLRDTLLPKLMNNYINLSKEDIQDFFIVQNERYIPFLLLSDTKKKEILSKLVGLNKYENVIPNISAEIEKNQNIIMPSVGNYTRKPQTEGLRVEMLW